MDSRPWPPFGRRRKERESTFRLRGIYGRAPAEDWGLCLKAGMEDYIAKLIQAIDLADILDQLVSEAV